MIKMGLLLLQLLDIRVLQRWNTHLLGLLDPATCRSIQHFLPPLLSSAVIIKPQKGLCVRHQRPILNIDIYQGSLHVI